MKVTQKRQEVNAQEAINPIYYFTDISADTGTVSIDLS